MGRQRTHPDQTVIAGTEPMPRNAKIRRLAKRYEEERDTRIAANAVEKAAHDSLMEAMVELGFAQDGYDDGSIQVFVDATRKCKVKTAAKPTAEEEADGEE